MKRKSFEDEDTQILKKKNTHEKRNSHRAHRKSDKRRLSEITSLDDLEEDYEWDEDEY